MVDLTHVNSCVCSEHYSNNIIEKNKKWVQVSFGMVSQELHSF